MVIISQSNYCCWPKVLTLRKCSIPAALLVGDLKQGTLLTQGTVCRSGGGAAERGIHGKLSPPQASRTMEEAFPREHHGCGMWPLEERLRQGQPWRQWGGSWGHAFCSVQVVANRKQEGGEPAGAEDSRQGPHSVDKGRGDGEAENSPSSLAVEVGPKSRSAA